MKAVVAAFNQEKALVGAFSVITNLQMELFQALLPSPAWTPCSCLVASMLGMQSCSTSTSPLLVPTHSVGEVEPLLSKHNLFYRCVKSKGLCVSQ